MMIDIMLINIFHSFLCLDIIYVFWFVYFFC